jgi:mono/diheme cytochrome c family protein/nitrate/TMAO reductase-like tetraheme cytochrome c subunit
MNVAWFVLLALLSVAGHAEEQPKRLNPFAGDPEALKEGRQLWLSLGCSGCHSLMGGGSAMAWPVLDDTWRFGSDDETLYKLVRGQIPQQTMPPFATLSDEQVWKALSYVRSLYKGDPALINWALAPTTAPPPAPPEEPATRVKDLKTPAPSHPAPRTVAKATNAAAVLYDIQCSICHGTTGAGDGLLALRLKDEPSDWTAGAGLAGMGDQEIFDVIVKGGMAVGKSAAMPDFPTLTEAQVQGLVAHVKGLRGNLEAAPKHASTPEVRPIEPAALKWGSSLDWAIVLTIVVSGLILCCIVASIVVYRGRQAEGNALWLHLLSLGIFPLMLLAVGNFSVLEYAKEDRFCGTCHLAMKPYMDDLRSAQSRSLAARHFQHRAAPNTECYSCHANYGVHGTFEAKMTGLRDVYRYVTRTYQLPLRMRAPYENALCLKCHGEAKRFVEAFEGVHVKLAEQLRTGVIKCIGCHKLAHDIPRVEQVAGLRKGD